MKIIRKSDLIETPWKNGGGITREIATAHEAEDVLWRLSMADVAVDSSFSNFSGLMRILTVISGAGMELESDQGILTADLNRPIRFDGALGVHSRLKDGPIQDLNLMFDPLRCDAEVRSIDGPYHQQHDAASFMMIGVHCTTGGAEIGGHTKLDSGDTALIQSGAIELKLGTAATALLIVVKNLSCRQ